jgi:hypothetical protein
MKVSGRMENNMVTVFSNYPVRNIPSLANGTMESWSRKQKHEKYNHFLE